MHVPAVRRRSNTRFGRLSMIANMMQIADLRRMGITCVRPEISSRGAPPALMAFIRRFAAEIMKGGPAGRQRSATRNEYGDARVDHQARITHE